MSFGLKDYQCVCGRCGRLNVQRYEFFSSGMSVLCKDGVTRPAHNCDECRALFAQKPEAREEFRANWKKDFVYSRSPYLAVDAIIEAYSPTFCIVCKKDMGHKETRTTCNLCTARAKVAARKAQP